VLSQTFRHVPGLGGLTERSLWQQGCTSWQTYLDNPKEFRTGKVSQDEMRQYLESSVQALDEKNHQYFNKVLGAKNTWRAWPEFKDTAVYLDIETDGGQSGESITMVGLYDGKEFSCLVKDDNLGSFPDVISNYGMIITFFGAGFDIPMLKKGFPSVRFDQIHIDLCFALKQVGIRGGLKKIEKQMGIARSDETDGLSGLDAIYLWRRFLRGEDEALKTLIAYNEEDVVNLEVLAQIAYDRLKATELRSADISVRDFGLFAPKD
jgi:uncharacterized protein YprB with RNaseH-like and TPR domain